MIDLYGKEIICKVCGQGFVIYGPMDKIKCACGNIIFEPWNEK